MTAPDRSGIVFKRLPEVDPADLMELMNDPLVRRHMPLARGDFGPDECARFVAAKERLWAEYGYGPWAFVIDGEFAGWGGLQPEDGEVDLGLVLRPQYWGAGKALYQRILAHAFEEKRFSSVTILLPPSRVRVSAIVRLGFRRDGEVEIRGERFMRYRLDAPPRHSERVIDVYERHAQEWDQDRRRSLFERSWLDRFTRHLPPGGTVLDVGCGAGEPIAEYLIRAGFAIVGVDASHSMIAMCRRRFPDSEWRVADMRGLSLGRRFHGILAWDSLFHLTIDDQRAMFERFAAHARPGAGLLFTSGPSESEAIGACRGEPLYHASLASGEYERLLTLHGFSVQRHRAEDPECGGHTVWLAVLERT